MCRKAARWLQSIWLMRPVGAKNHGKQTAKRRNAVRRSPAAQERPRLSGEEEARAEFTEEENRRTDADFSEAEAGGIGVQSSEREPAERKLRVRRRENPPKKKAEVAKPAGEETAEEGEEFSEVRTDAESLFQGGRRHGLMPKETAMTEKKGTKCSSVSSTTTGESGFYFYKAVSIDPKYRESYISLAKYQAETGRYEKAMKNIEKAIHLNPDLTDGYMVRGIICHLKGDNDGSDFQFQRGDRERVSGKSESLQLYL